MNQDQDRYLLLLLRKLSGEAGAAELAELERLLAGNEELRAQSYLLAQYWNQHEDEQQANVEESLQKLLGRLHEDSAPAPLLPLHAPVPSTRHRSWRWIAAACTVGIVVSAVYYYVSSLHPVKKIAALPAIVKEKYNGKGTRSFLTLPDSSRIWLNADSKLSYPAAFTGSSREVTLNGEAFFDVTKDPDKPFIIHLSNGTVRVLGTSFNIRAYDNENRIETSVLTGKVAFIPKYQDKAKKHDTLFLTPERKLRYIYSAEELLIKPSSAEEDKAWTEGRLIFKAETWEDIAQELERNFNKKIIFRDEALKYHRLTGSFQNNSLEEILYYLSKTVDFEYQIGEQEVIISYPAAKKH